MIQDRGGTGNFLYSKERVTQVDMLVMITYGLRVLPLFRELQEAHTKVIQPWYEDYTGVGRNFSFILAHLDEIMVWVTTRVYLLYSTNSFMVFFTHYLAQAESFFRWQGLTIITRSRYLGGYIGGATAKAEWLGEKFWEWEVGVNTMEGVMLIT